MTVSELIDKLSECEPDAVVSLPNDGLWLGGTYEITKAYGSNDEVVLASTYMHKVSSGSFNISKYHEV